MYQFLIIAYLFTYCTWRKYFGLSTTKTGFKELYEDLAVPKPEKYFDDEFLEHCDFHVSLIQKLTQLQSNDKSELFSEEEVLLCIKSLKNRKASDEFSFSAVHLRTAVSVILPVLKNILTVSSKVAFFQSVSMVVL